MRGIAKGQCIDVLVVDEVVKLVTRELSTALPQFATETKVTMEMVMTWMLRNNMLMESMQNSLPSANASLIDDSGSAGSSA